MRRRGAIRPARRASRAAAGVLWILAAGLAGLGWTGPQPARAEDAATDDAARLERLEKLQRRIEREQRALGEVDRKRAGVIENLRALEQSLADQESALREAEAAAARAARSQQTLEEGAARTQRELGPLESRLADRLAALYKLGDVGYFRILFSSRNYQDLARRTRFLRTIIAADAALIEAYRDKLREAAERATALEAQRAELARLRKTADARRAEVEARRREKLVLLESLGREKEARLAALAEFEEAARALEGTFEALRDAAPPALAPAPGPEGATGPEPAVPFSALRGRLPMPVDGRVVKRFGLRADPELGTRIRSNGVTLRAAYGDPIEAVHDGRVLYAGWFRGYGRILIMDHGEGFYTLIAHASKLLKRVGDRVRKGEEIARVGDSGSLEGPILYFEIRERGKPVDPMGWIGR